MWPCLAFFQQKPGAGIVVQCKLSPLVLAGFSALGPEPQQIGAYLPIHTRPGKLINRVISNTIHGRPLTKGVPATWRGKRKKLSRDYFLIQKPHWCERFPRPSEITWSLNMMTELVFVKKKKKFQTCFCFSQNWRRLLLWACGPRSLKNGKTLKGIRVLWRMGVFSSLERINSANCIWAWK